MVMVMMMIVIVIGVVVIMGVVVHVLDGVIRLLAQPAHHVGALRLRVPQAGLEQRLRIASPSRTSWIGAPGLSAFSRSRRRSRSRFDTGSAKRSVLVRSSRSAIAACRPDSS